MAKARKDEDYEILALLDRTQGVISKSRSKELGISPIEATVLSAIEHITTEAIPAEISRRVFRQPHGVCTLLQRMEHKGLVKRDKNLGRKNLVRVTMTEKGQHCYYMLTRGESIHRIMASLSEEEHQQLRSCLQKLHDKALGF